MGIIGLESGPGELLSSIARHTETRSIETIREEFITTMATGQTESVLSVALRAEQEQVSGLYVRLDEARDRAERTLREVYARGANVAGHQGRVEREVMAGEQAARLARLNAVERGLCFGRIDESDGRTTYIGRIGLRDEEYDSVLIDWRAPAARPFYVATSADPGSLLRRRHLHTRDRTVVGLDDEVFDLEAMSERDRGTLVGEAALMATLRRSRTGRMGDVVATIQTEQDRVIRSGLSGALVVQGGPGTGKTVAALHRAAYLLYAHRDTLERRGVLVVGPNAMFLRYIGQVLPSLGESQVVLASVGELYPGVRASESDRAEVAVVKGDPRMAALVARAVHDRQRVPARDLQITIDGLTITLDGEECRRTRDRARAVRLPHNMARKLYVTEMLRALALAEARALEAGLRLDEYEVEGFDLEPLALADDLDEDDLAEAARRLWAEPPVRRALDGLWPELTPQRLVGELLTDPERLEAAADAVAWADLDRRLLLRPAGLPWTVDDVPLLDEAAELLGEDDSRARQAERRARRAREEDELYAGEVLQGAGSDVLQVASIEELMGAGALADRHEDPGAGRSTADRAAADRAWASGHVIVDEAQELS